MPTLQSVAVDIPKRQEEEGPSIIAFGPKLSRSSVSKTDRVLPGSRVNENKRMRVREKSSARRFEL